MRLIDLKRPQGADSGRGAMILLDLAGDEPAQGFAILVPSRLAGFHRIGFSLVGAGPPRTQDCAGAVAISGHSPSSRLISLSLTAFLSLFGPIAQFNRGRPNRFWRGRHRSCERARKPIAVGRDAGGMMPRRRRDGTPLP